MAKFESYEQGVPSWIEHSSPDPQASKQFYGQLFGWDFDDEPMNDEQGNQLGVYSLAKIQGDRVAGLGPVMSPEQPSSWGVYLAADDVDDAVQKAQANGGEVLVPAMDVGEHGRMAWVKDPVGAAVGLWQAKSMPGSERANEHGTNIWNELVTADAGSATPFYDQMLGIKADQMDMGGRQTYTTFNVGGRSVGGTMAPQTEGVPPHWNVYFNVDDADAAVAKAKDLGAQEIAPAFDVPGVGRMAVLQDPQGAMFNLMQNPPAEG
jgi:predicted enzyme related to lactoylglutathione lyase